MWSVSYVSVSFFQKSEFRHDFQIITDPTGEVCCDHMIISSRTILESKNITNTFPSFVLFPKTIYNHVYKESSRIFIHFTLVYLFIYPIFNSNRVSGFPVFCFELMSLRLMPTPMILNESSFKLHFFLSPVMNRLIETLFLLY